jgi:hypothetical protein
MAYSADRKALKDRVRQITNNTVNQLNRIQDIGSIDADLKKLEAPEKLVKINDPMDQLQETLDDIIDWTWKGESKTQP